MQFKFCCVPICFICVLGDSSNNPYYAASLLPLLSECAILKHYATQTNQNVSAQTGSKTTLMNDLEEGFVVRIVVASASFAWFRKWKYSSDSYTKTAVMATEERATDSLCLCIPSAVWRLTFTRRSAKYLARAEDGRCNSRSEELSFRSARPRGAQEGRSCWSEEGREDEKTTPFAEVPNT